MDIIEIIKEAWELGSAYGPDTLEEAKEVQEQFLNKFISVSPPALVPNKYIKGLSLQTGEYLVIRRDGKTHLEMYNGTGFAYNDRVIEYFYTPKISL